MKTNIIVCLLALSVFSMSAVGAVVLEDNFDDGVLDVAKWNVVAGTVTETGGAVQIGAAAGRDYLVTVGQWDPADGAITISGTMTDMSDFEIWTRAANIQDPDFAGGTLDYGIRIGGWSAATDILEKLPGLNTWTHIAYDGGVATGAPQGEPVDFLITDTGTTVSITYTLVSDPLQTYTISGATSLPAMATNYIGFGGTGQVEIDNLVVSQVPEPATMALLGLGGLLLRRRK